MTAENVSYAIAPRINAAGRMDSAVTALQLVLCEDEDRAEELAHKLTDINSQRQETEMEIVRAAQELLDAEPERLEDRVILLWGRDWHPGVIGIVASRLSEKYACPSFMIHLSGGTGKGSCRGWGGFNLFAALESCSDLLLGFGGHELAAGFTIEEKNIPAFRQRMNQYASRFRGGKAPVSCLQVDVPIGQAGRVTLAEVEALDALEPYGAGNARPVFCLRGATLDRLQNVGQNRHLKLRLTKGSAQFDGIFFSAVAQTCGVAPGDRVDAAFYLQINEFRSSRTVQMQMVDIRPSLTGSTREEESLELVDRCLRGDELRPRDAVRLLPSRDQCVSLWRCPPTDWKRTICRCCGGCPERCRGRSPFCGRCCAWRCSGSGACCSAAAWATA